MLGLVKMYDEDKDWSDIWAKEMYVDESRYCRMNVSVTISRFSLPSH